MSLLVEAPVPAAAGGVIKIQPVASAQWPHIQAQLRAELGEDIYGSWFTCLAIEEVRGMVVYLSVPTPFLRHWLIEHYREHLLRLWQQQNKKITRIEISVRSAARNAKPPGIVLPKSPSLAPPPAVVQMPLRQLKQHVSWLEGSPLDQRFDLRTFCEGVANRIAFAAVQAVAQGHSQAESFNPLYIYGGMGCGKTHLLQATARAVRQTSPKKKVLYLTAEHFMFRFAAAFRHNSTHEFEEDLKDIDLLLLDGMQFLEGKSLPQELSHLLHLLISNAHQVVIAAQQPPRDLESLDKGILSLITGGIAFAIAPPDLPLRQAILGKRHALAQERNPGLSISEPILEYVARSITSGGRDLEGAFNRLVAQWLFTRQPVTLASAEVTLRDLIGAVPEPRRVKIDDIQRIVAQHYKVSKQDILSSRRARVVVRPRQIAMYLAKVLTLRSLPEIGRYFGGRDHTTVLHAVRKMTRLVAGDKEFAEEMTFLKLMCEK